MNVTTEHLYPATHKSVLDIFTHDVPKTLKQTSEGTFSFCVETGFLLNGDVKRKSALEG